MPLYTNDYLEYYLTLQSWIISNGIWNLLVNSGAIALPFLAVIVKAWFGARNNEVYDCVKGLISAQRVEHRVWVAIVVIMFACIPLIPINLTTLHFDASRAKQCQLSVTTPQQTRWAESFIALNNQNAQVPVWWFFMHSLAKAITGAAVATIPCGIDLRQIRMDLDAQRISNPLLAQEVADFNRACYGPARAKLFMKQPNLSEAQMSDVDWIGAHVFISTPGYYDAYHATTALSAWPYDPVRDAGLGNPSGAGGYPTCSQWWTDSNRGLRARLLKQVSPDVLSRIRRWVSFLPPEQTDDAVIRHLVSPRQQALNQGARYADYGGQLALNQPTSGANKEESNPSAPGLFPIVDAVRQTLPVVLSLLKMTLVVCTPLILLIATFDLKSLVTISCIQFALFFVDFWFQLARWVDATLNQTLYGWNSAHNDFNLLMGLNNSFGDMMLNIVMLTMYLVIPVIWMAGLTWSALRAANIIDGWANGTQTAGSLKS